MNLSVVWQSHKPTTSKNQIIFHERVSPLASFQKKGKKPGSRERRRGTAAGPRAHARTELSRTIFLSCLSPLYHLHATSKWQSGAAGEQLAGVRCCQSPIERAATKQAVVGAVAPGGLSPRYAGQQLSVCRSDRGRVSHGPRPPPPTAASPTTRRRFSSRAPSQRRQAFVQPRCRERRRFWQGFVRDVQ